VIRVIRAVLTLFLILTALIGVACGYGRYLAPRNPLRSLGFDVCGNTPCFAGIAAGSMSIEDAEKKLSQIAIPATDYPNVFHKSLAGNDTTINVYSDENADNATSLNILLPYLPPSLTLDRFIALYGLPHYVVETVDPTFVNLYYPKMMLTARLGMDNRVLSFNAPIEAINFRLLNDYPDEFPQYLIPWIGFTTSKYPFESPNG
jgi:hypothetical protein